MKLAKKKKSNIKPRTKAIEHDHDYSNMFDDVHMGKHIENQRKIKDRENLKNRFLYVKRLIKSKRYNDARYELVNIDHPLADRWLEKLNDRDPNYSEGFVLTPRFLLSVTLFAGFIIAVISLLTR